MDSKTEPLVFFFNIAGVQFRNDTYLKAIEHGIAEGDDLTLIPEPENPHDCEAVRVEWQGYHLGYIPKKEGADLKKILCGETKPYKAKLSILDTGAKPWNMFKVLVEI